MLLPRKYLLISLLIVIIGSSFFAGFELGKSQIPEIDKIAGLTNKDTPALIPVDFSPFWKAWNQLEAKFVPSSTSTAALSSEEKVWAAISGLARAYDDPYTVFLPPVQNELFKEDISGNFEGVGMEIGIRDNILTVIAPLKGSPAEKAGIRTGDKILEIDEESTSEMSVEEAVTLIRGPKGTEVKLTIFREGNGDAPETIEIIRDVINIPTLETEMKETKNGEKVFIIRLYSFSANSPELFRAALIEFSKAQTEKLIIDLRGNPGGYLEAAVDMASWFLPEGRVIVREYFGEGIKERVHRSRGYDVFTDALKLAVLIDQGSASASEILAGALREHGLAKLVGAKTFGKGSVQELVDITSDTSLKVTVARWLTPDGLSLSEGGLEPDFPVEIKKEDIETGKDPQLEKAIEILNL